jgi:excisionase family DNA binding protein
MSKTELLDVNEFAESLGVTVACIRRWILERRIAIVKVGRLVRIPATEAVRIIDAGQRPARPTKGSAGMVSR